MFTHMLLLVALAPGVEKKPDSDAQKIQGTWDVIETIAVATSAKPAQKRNKKGKPPSKETEEQERVIIDARSLRFVTGKKADFPEYYKLNSQAKPKEITLGPDDTKGIYELKGDDLKICLPIEASGSVNAFPNKPTKDSVTFVLKRAKSISLKDLDLPNQVPMRVREILDKAREIELLSLNPIEEDNPLAGSHFHGYKVLGKTVIKDKKELQKLIHAFYRGAADSDGSAAGCFNPRHGIRAQHDGKTTELVICFECQSMAIYGPGKFKGGLLTSSAPTGTFNDILKKSKVPLPKD